MSKRPPILCLDFDGVIHSYTSGWQGADVIPDPPVDGALRFILNAMGHFSVAIYSSRSHQDGGIVAMQQWLEEWFAKSTSLSKMGATALVGEIHFPEHKPPAMVSIDDRALTFEGLWPDPEELLAFKPWNKR